VPALEVDLGQTIATAVLAVAFTPPLQRGARIETLEAGKRWRIWDELFAYSVVKESDILQVVARTDAEERSCGRSRSLIVWRRRFLYLPT
jgi:hypothetical protein